MSKQVNEGTGQSIWIQDLRSQIYVDDKRIESVETDV